MTDLHEHWSRVGAERIFARVSPRREGQLDLVLVHGLVVSSRYLVPVGEILANCYNVFIPDLPGYGRSSTPAHVLDVPQLADALVAWMRRSRIERAVLLGNSMGCQIAVDAAARYPQHVAGLVLVGPTVDPAARDPVTSAFRQLRVMFHESPTLAAVILLDFLEMGPARSLRSCYHCLRDRIEEKLPRLRAPVLVVRGQHDAHVPCRWADEIMRRLPDRRLQEIPRGRHALNYSMPEELAGIVRRFIDQISGSSARRLAGSS